MRRFSDRNSLVTLSEINITPLLDLAFVLLIIFMITMPPMVENAMELDLPEGGDELGPRNEGDIRLVEVTPEGEVFLNKVSMTLDDMEKALVQAKEANSHLTVDFRGDSNSMFKYAARVLDVCTKNQIPIHIRYEKNQ
ncbi:MAG TPA: biopolymer transporter ExbD [Verrucomicrobiales bacterium]|jgi:biopolymer transport protein ExbD|nr:biopolymer transporter ExbD [Verrucomicrobiales bacterium]